MQDQFMFQNRFATGIGGFGIGARFGQNGLDMHSSAQYRQFHQMKAQMPSDVLELFKANQVGFLKAPVKPKCRSLDPVLTMKINLMEMFSIPNLELMEKQKPETRQQRLTRIAQQKKDLNENRIRAQIEEWNPFQENKIDSDPQKTLLVARLNYETTEKTLKFEFEKYGIIKKVRIIKDQNGKSRGYGFVEFDSKQDFIHAYKEANHRKIDGKRIIVDYEKGRTTLRWRPRRFGMGAGDSRMTKQQLEQKQKQQQEKKIQDRKQRKKSPKHSRSRSPKRQKRRDDYDDDRDRKRKSSKDRKDKKESRKDGREGRRN